MNINYSKGNSRKGIDSSLGLMCIGLMCKGILDSRKGCLVGGKYLTHGVSYSFNIPFFNVGYAK